MKAHRTDGVSLVFALIFLGVAAWWLFAQLMHLTLPAVGWLLAGALIAVGALGLVGALRANRSGRRKADRTLATPAAEPLAPAATLTDAEAPTAELTDFYLADPQLSDAQRSDAEQGDTGYRPEDRTDERHP